MTAINGEAGFTQLTKLNVIEKLLVGGNEIVQDSLIIVKEASDLTNIDSTKEYFIDGVIDMGNQSIIVPAGGLSLSGYSVTLSKLFSTEDNYTLFTGATAGNVFLKDVTFDVSGLSSQVYNLTSNTGLEAIEQSRVNFENCTSLGEITNYRQGVENETARLGGTPELTLSGTWLGGYLVTTSIVRSLTDGAYTLFKAGTAFNMASRFKSDQNVDLPASVSYLDFSASNFANPSTLQLEGMIITRDGVFDPTDANLTPNILYSDLASSWSKNNGLRNTFEGGELDVTTEIATVITVQGQFEDLAGTFTASKLEHFDSPSNSQLRHIGNSPIEYRIQGQFALDSTANNEVDLKAVIFRSATTTFEDAKVVRGTISSFAGSRDVGFYSYLDIVTLNKNDYVKFQVANIDSTSNVTAELNSFFLVEVR